MSKRNLIATIFSAILGLIFFILWIYYLIQGLKHADSVNGTIKHIILGYRTNTLIVEYIVSDKSYTKDLNLSSRNSIGYTVGSTIPVYYDKTNPEDSSLTSTTTSYILSSVFFILGILFIITSVIIYKSTYFTTSGREITPFLVPVFY
jgi:hypothetical protein